MKPTSQTFTPYRWLSTALAATFSSTTALSLFTPPAWSQAESPALAKPPKTPSETPLVLPPIEEELIVGPPVIEPQVIEPQSVEPQGRDAQGGAIAPVETNAAPADLPPLTPLPPPIAPGSVPPSSLPSTVEPAEINPSEINPTELEPPSDEIWINPVFPEASPSEPLPQPPGYQVLPYQDRPTNEFNQYRLSVGDGLSVFVVGFPEFSTQGSIDLEGNLLIPILGQRDFRGLTLQEVQDQVSVELGQQYLQTPPEVVVSLLNPRPASVTVTGEVVEPGFYELAPGSNPFDAIFRAGGSRPTADLRSVLVRRTLRDGSVIEQTVDLLSPLQTGTPLPNLLLLDGDAIVISRLAPENQAEYDRQLAASSNLAQATITVRVFNKPGNRLGAIQLPNGSTFADALTALAPNTTDSRLGSIALIRFDPEQGRPVTQKLDGRQALLGNSTHDVPLEDQDVIVVGRTLIASVSNALNQFTRPFRDVLGFLLFFREIGDSADTIFSP
ncbi:MAG: SLBB domain-containing protein [Spirulinaceae cyanobacterium]